MLLVPFLALGLGQQQQSEGWLYVAKTETSARLEMEIRQLDWGQLEADAKATGKNWVFVEHDSRGYVFDDSVWQSKLIEHQKSVYDGINRLAFGDTPLAPAVIYFLKVALNSVGLSAEPGVEPAVSVVRHITFKRGNEEITLELSMPGPLKPDHQTIEAPRLTIPCDGPEKAATAVQYPTSYGFLGTGRAIANFDIVTLTRQTAIDILDQHLDDFADLRAEKRNAIEAKIDGIDRPAIEGKAFTDLPKLVERKIVQAAKVYAGRKPVHGDVADWVKLAHVEHVSTKIYLLQVDTRGDSVAVEVP